MLEKADQNWEMGRYHSSQGMERILIDESKGRGEFYQDYKPCKLESGSNLKRTLMELSYLYARFMCFGFSPCPPEENR